MIDMDNRDFWAIWLRDLDMVYALFFWVVICVRLFTRTLSRKEGLLLFIFLLHHSLECVQLCIGVKKPFFTDRYFGPAAPLMWGWTAYGIYILWKQEKYRRWIRTMVGVILVVSFALQIRQLLRYHRRIGSEAYVVAEEVAQIIREDYKGPTHWENFPYTNREFFTNRRPSIVGSVGYIPYMMKAQGEIGTAPYPMPIDYYYVKEKEAHLVPIKRRRFFKEIGRVKSIKDVWVIYRMDYSSSPAMK